MLDTYFAGRDVVRDLDVSEAWDAWPTADQCDMSLFEMTHMAETDVDVIVNLVNKNITFWLELGSYHGGSAITTAASLKRLGQTDASVICVDSFLGDPFSLWWAKPCVKNAIVTKAGVPNILPQFVDRVRKSGHDDMILGWPATSLVVLRIMSTGADNGEFQRPEVIYLDSAHLAGEVLLEMEQAWRLLPKGGVLWGDDFGLDDVKQDVLKFTTLLENINFKFDFLCFVEQNH